MSGDAKLPTCGPCLHFRRDPMNLRQGHCRAMPPTAALASNPRGEIVTVGSGFPAVHDKMDACGMFKRRLTVIDQPTG